MTVQQKSLRKHEICKPLKVNHLQYLVDFVVGSVWPINGSLVLHFCSPLKDRLSPPRYLLLKRDCDVIILWPQHPQLIKCLPFNCHYRIGSKNGVEIAENKVDSDKQEGV